MGVAGAEYMGFWVRALAAAIDWVVLFLLQLALSLAGGGLLGLLVGPVYAVLFIGLRGQTPGKMALGLQVVNEAGTPPGVGRAIQREVIGKVVSALAILLGYLWIGWDGRKRGWHDYIGGTYVVRKGRPVIG